MKHPQYENTLLIATYSPSRAKKDKEERKRFLEKLKKMGKIESASSEDAIKIFEFLNISTERLIKIN
jgi:hypothetical protein